jgi:hypothetical protein
MDQGDDKAAQQDNVAVHNFAGAMKAKMAASRAKGRGGWLQCPVDQLQAMLTEHLNKGDPVDVANFAMMLWNRGGTTAGPAPMDADVILKLWRDCGNACNDGNALKFARKVIECAGHAAGDQLYRDGLKTGNDLCEATYASLLPYSYYMDPPDGGSVTIFEQMSRMAEDAAKWREVHEATEKSKYGSPLSWQERCNWQSDEPATKLMVEAMQAEIAELRAVLVGKCRDT